MRLPEATHLQFLVISALLRGSVPGRVLREHLRGSEVRQSSPAFYQMMAVMEDRGFVEGWYEQQVIDGQILRERHYKVLPAGRKAWKACSDFYRRAIAVQQRGLALDA